MAHSMKGIIALWSGDFDDIPFGWKLCDGTNGTPDLSQRFIRAAGVGMDPHRVGGTTSHRHAVDFGSHAHDLPSGDFVQSGTGFGHSVTTSTVTGSTDSEYHIPSYYALCYIMHI